MQRFRNILCYLAPGDRSNGALDQAFALARSNACPLKLLGVVEPMSRLVARALPGSADLEGLLVERQQGILDELASRPEAEGVQVTTSIRRERPFLGIIHEVIESGHDLVVKSAQGTTSAGSLGVTALNLMRKCPCPVWVIKPESTGFRRIIAAVDPLTSDELQARLQRRILEVATSLASTHEAQLSVVHAWDLPGESLLRNRMNPNELEQAVDAQRAQALEGSKVLVEGLPVDPDSITLIKGLPGQAITSHLEQSDVDLVVMGTLSRSGVPGLFIGNTAERVLKELHCSVLTVKPDDFVSPVAPPVTGLRSESVMGADGAPGDTSAQAK